MKRSQIILLVLLLLIAALFVSGIALGQRGGDNQRLNLAQQSWLQTIQDRLVIARTLTASDMRLAADDRPECRLDDMISVPSGGSCGFTIAYSSDPQRTLALRLSQGTLAHITIRVPGTLTQRDDITPDKPYKATLNRGDTDRSALLFVECASTASESADCLFAVAH